MSVSSFIRMKWVQMGAHDFKHNKVPLFARKQGNINVLRSAAPKLALVPASHYNCDKGHWKYKAFRMGEVGPVKLV